MKSANLKLLATATTLSVMSSFAFAADADPVADKVIIEQRSALSAATDGAGFGPQSPRDIESVKGNNSRAFGFAPPPQAMNLCNIHFHENAEHRGGEFTTYAGNGNGKGYGTGFKYSGKLSAAELAPYGRKVGENSFGYLESGDTIEIHFVHTSAQVEPGPTLAACVSEAIGNPHLRVETVVAVLVNDGGADFTEMATIKAVDGLKQASVLPNNLGQPVQYSGSTTGPGYNEAGSPFHVTWSVRPKVLKLNIASVDTWLQNNPFNERYAHGVRNLVQNPDLLSPIK